MVNFKEIYHFSRFQRGSNFFQGVQLFPGGGVQLLIPYRNQYLVIFQGGGGSGSPVPPPLWIRIWGLKKKKKKVVKTFFRHLSLDRLETRNQKMGFWQVTFPITEGKIYPTKKETHRYDFPIFLVLLLMRKCYWTWNTYFWWHLSKTWEWRWWVSVHFLRIKSNGKWV